MHQQAAGHWTAAEQERFLEAIHRYGNDWRLVQQHIGTRTGSQIRSHYQKYQKRIGQSTSQAVPLRMRTKRSDQKPLIENPDFQKLSPEARAQLLRREAVEVRFLRDALCERLLKSESSTRHVCVGLEKIGKRAYDAYLMACVHQNGKRTRAD